MSGRFRHNNGRRMDQWRPPQQFHRRRNSFNSVWKSKPGSERRFIPITTTINAPTDDGFLRRFQLEAGIELTVRDNGDPGTPPPLPLVSSQVGMAHMVNSLASPERAISVQYESSQQQESTDAPSDAIAERVKDIQAWYLAKQESTVVDTTMDDDTTDPPIPMLVPPVKHHDDTIMKEAALSSATPPRQQVNMVRLVCFLAT